MQDEEKFKKLQARLDYYQEAHRNILDVLHSTAEWGDFRPEHGRFNDKRDVLKDSASKIMRIAPFQSMGLWLVDESSQDFYLAHQVPEDTADTLDHEFSRLADQGLIALAISSEKPVFASGSLENDRLMIQVIATASRVRGIFMGRLRYLENLPDATAPLIMILCQNCASSLEALELYSLLREKNKALQEREDRLDKVMTAINEGIWDWHLPSGTLYFDDRYYTMAGYQPGEFPSTLEEFRKRVHPDDYPKLQLAIDQHFSGEKAQLDWVFRFLKKDGNWLWIRGRGKVIQRDEQGGPVRIVGTHTDISDRMEAEQNMLDSQERYRLLSQLTMEGIIIHKQGIVRDANKSAAAILGYSREELLGKDIVTLAFHPEDHGLIRENIQKEYASPYVARGIRKDGTWFYAEIEARNFSSGNEELRVGAIRDITERKKAEQALIQSHERLKTVMNSIQAMVYITDLKTHEIIFCNEYARQEFGKIMGRRCWEVMREDQTGPCRFCDTSGLLREDGSPGQVISREIRNQRTGKWYDCRDRAIYWTDGRVVRLQIATDITQRKLDQERLNRINTQLEKAIAEKDKFFSIIAHDLKSPMSGLLSLSGMMAEDSGKWTAHEMQEAGTSLHKSAKNLFALLENLLQWSRMQRGLIEYQPEAARLKNLLEAGISVLISLAAQKDITINSSISDELMVMADEFMISTVIRNLVSNAVKFTPRGGSVHVSARPEQDMVRVFVQDSGIGMNQDQIQSIFCLENKTSRPGTEGETSTGLGLVLCRDFVHAHGGGMEIQSDGSQGTTVSFTLPRADTAE